MELDRDFLQKLDVVKTTALKGVSKTTVQHFKKLECHKTDISDIEGFIVVSKKTKRMVKCLYLRRSCYRM